MAKKSRNKKTKYKKRNPAAALLDGLLTLLDHVLEGFAAAVVALLRGIGWLTAGLLRGLLWLVKRLLLLLAWPLGRLWRLMTGRRNRAQRCLRLTGFEFEEYMAQVLRDNGFRHVEVTVECGDQGVDILAVRGGSGQRRRAGGLRGRGILRLRRSGGRLPDDVHGFRAGAGRIDRRGAVGRRTALAHDARQRAKAASRPEAGRRAIIRLDKSRFF